MDATLNAGRARLADAAPPEPPRDLVKASQEFEAFILRMLLQEMRKSVEEDGLFQDRSTRGYQALLDDALAQRAAEAGSFGLAQQLLRELGAQAMKPLTHELVGTLAQETVLLKELVELLQGDQQRIIKQDIPALEASNRRKEEVVLRFQSLESARSGLTRQLGMELGLASEDLRISKISPLLGADGKDLEQAAEKLRALVGTFQELVEIGRGFLEQSILGIRSLLALIQSLRTPSPQTYSSTGQLETRADIEAVAIRREV